MYICEYSNILVYLCSEYKFQKEGNVDGLTELAIALVF